LFDCSGLKEGSEIDETDLILTQLSHPCSDRHEIIANSTNISVGVDNCYHEKMIEQLMTLRHPCISGIIGVVHRSELSVLKIVVMDFGGNSLSRIVSRSPSWWTPTVKAKAIVGVVFCTQFWNFPRTSSRKQYIFE
jgi:hypothetical protein